MMSRGASRALMDIWNLPLVQQHLQVVFISFRKRRVVRRYPLSQRWSRSQTPNVEVEDVRILQHSLGRGHIFCTFQRCPPLAVLLAAFQYLHIGAQGTGCIRPIATAMPQYRSAGRSVPCSDTDADASNNFVYYTPVNPAGNTFTFADIRRFRQCVTNRDLFATITATGGPHPAISVGSSVTHYVQISTLDGQPVEGVKAHGPNLSGVAEASPNFIKLWLNKIEHD